MTAPLSVDPAVFDRLVHDGWPAAFLAEHPVAVPVADRYSLDVPWSASERGLFEKLSRAVGGPQDAAVLAPLLRGPDAARAQHGATEGPVDAVPLQAYGALARAFFSEARRLVRDPAHAERVGALAPLYRAVFRRSTEAARGPAAVPLAVADPEGFAAFAERWPVDYLFHPTFHTVDRLLNRGVARKLGGQAEAIALAGVRTFADLEAWYRAATRTLVEDQRVRFLDNDEHRTVTALGYTFRRLPDAAAFAAAVAPLQDSPYAASDPFYIAAEDATGQTGIGPEGPWYAYAAEHPDGVDPLEALVVLDPYYRQRLGHSGELGDAVDAAFGPIAAQRAPLLEL